MKKVVLILILIWSGNSFSQNVVSPYLNIKKSSTSGINAHLGFTDPNWNGLVLWNKLGDVRIKTSGSEYHFNSNGNFGVGTTSPANVLQIGKNPAGYSGNDMVVSNVNGSFAIHNNSSNTYLWGSNDIAIRPNGNMAIYAKTNGNVGIGTSSPQSNLHVVGKGIMSRRFSISDINDRTNNGPWYGLGLSNFNGLSINNTHNAVQVAGYYGLLFKTASGVLGIHQNGHVGIGTTNPQANLHVEGKGIMARRFSISNINDQINNSPWYGLGLSNFNGLSINNTHNAVQVAGYYGLLFKTAQGVIGIHQNGNVGIGTTDPSAKLEVHGMLKIVNGNTDLFLYRDNDVGDWSLLRTNRGNGIGLVGKPDVIALAISRTSGNVLIGKTTQVNPTYKLDVEGKVRAHEIVVNTTGADYVFEEDYNLKSLTEVEKFIQNHHHLPGIKPAKEMEEDGVSVAELNTKLLEKIEELTLHMIQMEKELRTLKNTSCD